MQLTEELAALRSLGMSPAETTRDVHTLHSLLAARKHDQIIKFFVSRPRAENAYLGRKYQALYGDMVLLAPELRARAFGSLSIHGSDVVNGADQVYEIIAEKTAHEENAENFALVPQAYYYGEAIRAFLTLPAEYDAYCIWDSLNSEDDCLDEIIEILCLRSASEMYETERHFLRFSRGKPLGDALLGEIIPRTDLHRLVTSFFGFLRYKQAVVEAEGAGGAAGAPGAPAVPDAPGAPEDPDASSAPETPKVALATASGAPGVSGPGKGADTSSTAGNPANPASSAAPGASPSASPNARAAALERAWENALSGAALGAALGAPGGVLDYNLESDARKLYQASKEFKNKELAFFEVFLFRPRAYLAALGRTYKDVNGVTLQDTLEAEFPGIISYAFTLILEHAECPAKAYARVLHRALSKDRDRIVLRTLLSCYDSCMPEVLARYREAYGKELPKALKGISSGNFRAVLLAMCQGS